MSAYSFIASSCALPELDNTKKRFVTPAEAIALGLAAPALKPWADFSPDSRVLVFDDEESMYELQITANQYTDLETLLRTCLPYIYTLDFVCTERRAAELADYLRENARPSSTIELWDIWLDDPAAATPVEIELGELTAAHIQTLYDRCSPRHVYPACLRVRT